MYNILVDMTIENASSELSKLGIRSRGAHTRLLAGASAKLQTR